MAAVFVHCEEGRPEDAFTLKVKTSLSLEAALARFASKYEAKTGKSLFGGARWELVAADSVRGEAVTQSSWSGLKSKSDVFARRVVGGSDEKREERDTTVGGGKEEEEGDKGSVSVGKEPDTKEGDLPPEKAAIETKKTTTRNAGLEKELEKGRAALARKSLVEAKACFSGLLSSSEVEETRSAEAARGLAETYYAAGLYREASREAEKVAEATGLPEDWHLAARARSKHGDLSGCAMSCERALAEIRKKNQNDESTVSQDVVAILAWTLIQAGTPGDAVRLVEAVLAKNAEHRLALRCYARLAAEAGKIDDELSLLLRGVVLCAQSNKHTTPDEATAGLKRDLAIALDRPQSLDRLDALLGCSPPNPADREEERDCSQTTAAEEDSSQEKQQKTNTSTDAGIASAVAFLATVAKDNGAIHAAAGLLARAAARQPSTATYALNLVHALEVTARSPEGLDAALAFLKHNAHTQVGPVSFQDVLDALRDDSKRPRLRWVPDESRKKTDGGAGFVVDDNDDFVPSRDRAKQTYDDASLDALALLFVVVKLLFLLGRASEARRCAPPIEAARRSSAVELHHTTIRNEHAYYCCVAQLLCADPDRCRPTSEGCLLEVSVVGDSHALSPAWKRFDLGGGHHCVLRPHLVTGLKHWHLRPGCDFYPKRNFYAVLGLDPPRRPDDAADDADAADASASPGDDETSTDDELDLAGRLGVPAEPSPHAPERGSDNRDFDVVPAGSVVVFILGEIDCREGILEAVQKLRYPNLQEGVRRTAARFVDAADAFVQARKLSAFVHPVPPVLDATRPIVKLYNAALKALVDASPHLTWLDFFPGFLTDDSLKPQYHLDGTHLHPSYLDDLLLPALKPHLLRFLTTDDR